LARGDYQQALNEDPANRDALLGMAALDVRGGAFRIRRRPVTCACCRPIRAIPRRRRR
jgi:hypothetical protein